MTEFARMFFMLLLALACCALSLFCWLLWRELKALAIRMALQPAAETSLSGVEQRCRAMEQVLSQRLEEQQQALQVLHGGLVQIQESLNTIRAELKERRPEATLPPVAISKHSAPTKLADATADLRRNILELHCQGTSDAEIARRVNVSRHEVQMIIGLQRHVPQQPLSSSTGS
jgi:ATP/maltotriose-dependent transcriptional regulator MalT